MSKLLAPATSRRSIEDLAKNIRRYIGMENDFYIPVIKVVELVIPGIDTGFSYDIVKGYELENDEYAKYYPLDNLLKIRSDVYEAACDDDGRHRFTIAHELGHYFLHNEDVSFSRCDDKINYPIYRDPEWQANTFASAFLMPKHLITGMSVSQISENCKTSYEASYIAYKNAQRASIIRN